MLPDAEHHCAAAVAVADTQRWLERAVVGLNLCPFAKAVHTRGQIHYAVSSAETAEKLLFDLEIELNNLLAMESSARDTTLLIAPYFGDFDLFNDLCVLADLHLRLHGLQKQIQLASFHPRYRFAGAPEGDISHAAHRSPHPTLHLLREASVAAALAGFPDADKASEAILERNGQTLRKLGWAGWQALGTGPCA